MQPMSRMFETFVFEGCSPEDGVPDMTVISGIDEKGINTNLKNRYNRDNIYVSFITFTILLRRRTRENKTFP